MLHVIVTMRIKEGRMPDFLAACAALRPLVLQEPGCHAYDYTRDAESPFGSHPPVEAEGGQGGLRLVMGGAARRRIVGQGLAGHHRLLRHEGDLQPGLEEAFARIGLDLAVEDAQQGGLARAVAAD